MDSSDLDWPTLADVKQKLDVTSTDWDDQIDVLRVAAIDQIKAEVGDWDELTDAPDEALSSAALLRVYELASADASLQGTVDRFGTRHLSKSEQLLMGHRRRFPFA